MNSYVFWIIIGAFLMVFGGLVLGYVIETLLVYIFIYKPLVDFYFIRKRCLYKGRNLLLKYPFWGYGGELLFGE